MSHECCGQSKNQKGQTTLTELAHAARKLLVKESLLKLYGITIDNIDQLTDQELKDLSSTLREDMLVVTTELVKRTGTETSCGCTMPDLHDPVKVNIPGVGCCSYSGD